MGPKFCVELVIKYKCIQTNKVDHIFQHFYILHASVLFYEKLYKLSLLLNETLVSRHARHVANVFFEHLHKNYIQNILLNQKFFRITNAFLVLAKT